MATSSSQFFEEIITTSRMRVIDQAVSAWNIKKLKNMITRTKNKLNNVLIQYDTIISQNKIPSMADIRQELQSHKMKLLPVASEAYYLISRIKDEYNGEESLYTLGVEGVDGNIERAQVTLRGVMQIMGQISRTSSANGAQAILVGSVSLKNIDMKNIKQIGMTDDDVLLYQKMSAFEQQVKQLNNKGKFFEAFEIAKSRDYKANTLDIEKYLDCCREASGNIPFFKLAGDVKGSQVKFGGFSFCRAKTCLTVLFWLEQIFALIAVAPHNPKSIKMLSALFEENTTMQTTVNRLEQIMEDKILKEVEKTLPKEIQIGINTT